MVLRSLAANGAHRARDADFVPALHDMHRTFNLQKSRAVDRYGDGVWALPPIT
jgi:hypothetical protein